MKKWHRVVAASGPYMDHRDVFQGLIKGRRGNIDEAIGLTPECLSAMHIGDKLVVTDIRDVQYSGEYTEWSFAKSSDDMFICTRRERVYTGSGITGYKVETFGEGTWSADRVASQVQYNPAMVTKYSVFDKGSYDTTIFFTRD